MKLINILFYKYFSKQKKMELLLTEIYKWTKYKNTKWASQVKELLNIKE